MGQPVWKVDLPAWLHAEDEQASAWGAGGRERGGERVWTDAAGAATAPCIHPHGLPPAPVAPLQGETVTSGDLAPSDALALGAALAFATADAAANHGNFTLNNLIACLVATGAPRRAARPAPRRRSCMRVAPACPALRLAAAATRLALPTSPPSD